MKKLSHHIVFVILLLFSVNLWSQAQFKKVSPVVKSIKTFKSVQDLSQKLTFNFKTEMDKVKSIFFWITQNIVYDVNEYRADSAHSYYNIIKYKQNGLGNDSLLNAKVLDSVLRKKAAICDGYARLFKTLCKYSNIQSEMIEGMGKNSAEQVNTYNSNHAWNSVFIDNKWYLLDACWASGKCDTSVTKFTRELDEFYFLSESKYFSYNHFPDDKKYFYYDSPISKQQFIALPLVYSAFFSFGFDNFNPSSGLLNLKKNGKVQISVSKLMPQQQNSFSSGSTTVNLKRSEIKYIIDIDNFNPSEKSFVLFYKGKSVLEYKIKSD